MRVQAAAAAAATAVVVGSSVLEAWSVLSVVGPPGT